MRMWSTLGIAIAAIGLAAAAMAQPMGVQGLQQQQQQRGRFAPENEAENNSLSFLLARGYQIAAGWDGTLVLQRNDRVYLCPYARYRQGGDRRDGSQVTSQMCQHIREGVQF